GAGRPASTWYNSGSSYDRFSGYPARSERGGYDESPARHYSYEDEDQSVRPSTTGRHAQRPARPGNSLDNIAQFFTQRAIPAPKSRPKLDLPEPTGKTGLKSGQRVRHPKYGEGVVFRREGDGEDAKVTVQFSKFGVKKLVEKFAQLERL
ncbi:MAG: ATP-dependent DNA helicase Rep, partial [Acidobacteriaceae bacterium]|nr:ATP-dependent DNA helicase Rep [Acidobacteriaceae bacterium]